MKLATSTSFRLGPLFATPGAMAEIAQIAASLGCEPKAISGPMISRHFRKDWGDLGDEDKRLNDEAVHDGSRILSRYDVCGVSFYVITEAELENAFGQAYRSHTTLILKSEY